MPPDKRTHPLGISRPGPIPEPQFRAAVIQGRTYVDAVQVAGWLETLGRMEEAHYLGTRAQAYAAAKLAELDMAKPN